MIESNDDKTNFASGYLTCKHVAEAFWNGEVENELRDNQLDFRQVLSLPYNVMHIVCQLFIRFVTKSDGEVFIDRVDSERAHKPYVHNNHRVG